MLRSLHFLQRLFRDQARTKCQEHKLQIPYFGGVELENQISRPVITAAEGNGVREKWTKKLPLKPTDKRSSERQIGVVHSSEKSNLDTK